jgi:hypothetical protein
MENTELMYTENMYIFQERSTSRQRLIRQTHLLVHANSILRMYLYKSNSIIAALKPSRRISMTCSV